MGDQERDIPAPEPAMSVEETEKGALLVRISDRIEPRLFDEIATLLEHEYHGEWTGKGNGAGDRSWNLTVGDSVVTLREEKSLGISLSSAPENADMQKANQLVLAMVELLQERVE